MPQQPSRPIFPRWWAERIKEPISTYNPRLATSREALEREWEERARRDVDALLWPIASNASLEDRRRSERIHHQVQSQRELLLRLLKTTYEIEEINNQIVYSLAGDLLVGVQGGITGEVRVRLMVEVRRMQEHRAALEQQVLELWEQVGQGYRDSERGVDQHGGN